MVRINQVKIENFQSHENTILDFTKGLNVIVGPSDQGKSAIIRAIKWVLYNEPRGTDFIRQGTNTARVTLGLSNGYMIIRERSQNKNKYVVFSPDNEATTFEGFGNEVPEEVIKAHGIPKIMLDSDTKASLNVGDQLEAPFLLSQSGAMRAKAIGRLIGVHIIDKAIRDGMVDLRRENQTSDRLKDELEKINENLEEYKDLGLIEDKLEMSEKMIQRLEGQIRRKEKLTALKTSMDQIESEYKVAQNTLEQLKHLNQCELYLKESQLKLNQFRMLRNLETSFHKVCSGIDSAQTSIAKTEFVGQCTLDLKTASEKNTLCCKLHRASQKLDIFYKERSQLETVLHKTHRVDELEGIIKKIGDKKKKNESLSQKLDVFDNVDKKLKEINKVLDKSKEVYFCDKILRDVEGRTGNFKQILQLKVKYDAVLEHIKEGKKYLENNLEEINELIKKYTQQLKKIGKCPLCRSEISQEKLEGIIKGYKEEL